MTARVLVVDDEPDVEPLFRQQFRGEVREGLYQLDFARSGEAALHMLDGCAGEEIILLLVDIDLPRMGGLGLLAKVKARRPGLPVFIISAYGDAETKRTALEKGAEALLTKPIDFGTLRSEIDIARSFVERVEIVGEGLPVPRHAGGHHHIFNVFHFCFSCGYGADDFFLRGECTAFVKNPTHERKRSDPADPFENSSNTHETSRLPTAGHRQ